MVEFARSKPWWQNGEVGEDLEDPVLASEPKSDCRCKDLGMFQHPDPKRSSAMPHTQHLGAEAWGGMWLENSKCIHQPSSICAPWVIGAVNIWKTSSPVITLASYLLQQHGCLESPVVAKQSSRHPSAFLLHRGELKAAVGGIWTDHES